MSIDCAFYGAVHRSELKTSQNGRPYLRLNIRCGDGDAAQWVNVMAFDAEAIAAADRFTQGTRVYVEGRISINEWTANDGTKRHGLSVLSWHCRLPHIGKNRPKQAKPQSKPQHASTGDQQSAGERPFYSDDTPF